MKLIFQFTLFCLTLFKFYFTSAQTPGEWTWMNGPSTTNTPGVFGTQGIPSPLNYPPTFYEAIEWTDLQGNFWLYGGIFSTSGPDVFADMWMFNPTTNEWTWINGTGIDNILPNYGTKGVASSTNHPGSRAWGIDAWADSSGNLWMFGGAGFTSSADRSDLWKYDISTNMWTWMSGDNFVNSTGNYGTQGIPSILNSPPAREESSTSWIDNSGNFWLWGGVTSAGYHNDLWKYFPSTNEWAWMKGSNFTGANSIYGTLGVSDSANTPGARYTYSHWKDNSNNLWLLGGNQFPSGIMNDLWKYNINTNEWTWMHGPNTPNNPGNYISLCDANSNNYPGCRSENKACWTDHCGNFWLMGGKKIISGENRNDLWMYNPTSNLWMWVNGDSAVNTTGNFGTRLVSNPNNLPPPRNGSCSWIDNNGYLWFFGGGFIPRGDMWRYVPDPCCGGCDLGLPSFTFTTSEDQLCPGTCTSFQIISCNTTNVVWNFPGASPNSSTDIGPTNICYSTPGNYDVTLIASNAGGSDTLTLQNYITVFPLPTPQSITQIGDTLFAIAGSISYQWFFSGNIIPGATGYYYVAPTSGNYSVVATDNNGCEVEAAITNVIAGLTPALSKGEVVMFPNPVLETLTVIGFTPSGTSPSVVPSTDEISIYNLLGEKIPLVVNCCPWNVDCRPLHPGLYYLELMADEKIFRSKFVKQ